MAQRWLFTSSSRPGQGLSIVRFTVAILLGVHSIYRIAAGDVAGFGKHLDSIGFSFGVALGWFITLSTLVSSVALVLNKFVIPACICHIAVLVVGIIVVHVHAGWFVVGGGRNGMEYSVALIACLAAILWSYWPRR